MPSILGDGGIFGGGLSLLSIAKSTSSVGLSPRARAATQKFLSETQSYGNSMFSAGASASLTPEQLQQQILALRARMPADKLASGLGEEKLVLKSGRVGRYIDTRA